MRGEITASIIAVLLLAALLLPMSCTSSSAASADIVAGSSHITDIIQDIADGKLKARTLIPPGMCPGHYDVKPSDIAALANSKALFIHDYQQSFKNITGVIEAAENHDLTIKVISAEGEWMAPPSQAGAVDAIAQALGEIDPENSAYYQEKATTRTQAVLTKGEELKDKLQDANVSGVKVICVEYQAELVEWAGFDIVATYGRPEDLSVVDMEKLVVEAKEAGVALVIDNLQSGATATSEAMAQDIGAIQVTISNFPGGFEDTETWEKALDKNVDLLLEALHEWREQYG